MLEAKNNLLSLINKQIEHCQKCSLCSSSQRGLPVYGEGNPDTKVVFVGEAPGQKESETGRPFVGRAGKMLGAMIEAIDLKREDVFTLNINKCRPPNNRKPEPEEMAACKPYLEMQLEVIKPKVIVALGATAADGLLGPGPGITKRRGNWESYLGIPVMPSFHPAALLRNPKWKEDAWYDFESVKEKLNEF